MKNNRFLVFVEEYKPEIEKLVGTESPVPKPVFSSIPFTEFSLVTSLSNWF